MRLNERRTSIINKNIIMFNRRKVPLFRGDCQLDKEVVERSIVLGINKITDNDVKKRLLQLKSVQLSLNGGVVQIKLYDQCGECCVLEVIPMGHGYAVEYKKE